MKTLPALLLSLSLVALAWTLGRAVDKGITLKIVHMLTTPAELAEMRARKP